MSISLILVILALLFDVFSMIKPAWPLAQVAILLLCVALLARDGGAK